MTKNSTKSKKICAGMYEVTDGENTVMITQVYYPNDGKYWVAAAQWDSSRFSDPLYTKHDAMKSAKYMLEHPHF